MFNGGRRGGGTKEKSKDFFGSLKDKIKFIAPDFDEPIEDFAEYM